MRRPLGGIVAMGAEMGRFPHPRVDADADHSSPAAVAGGSKGPSPPRWSPKSRPRPGLTADRRGGRQRFERSCSVSVYRAQLGCPRLHSSRRPVLRMQTHHKTGITWGVIGFILGAAISGTAVGAFGHPSPSPATRSDGMGAETAVPRLLPQRIVLRPV